MKKIAYMALILSALSINANAKNFSSQKSDKTNQNDIAFVYTGDTERFDEDGKVITPTVIITCNYKFGGVNKEEFTKLFINYKKGGENSATLKAGSVHLNKKDDIMLCEIEVPRKPGKPEEGGTWGGTTVRIPGDAKKVEFGDVPTTVSREDMIKTFAKVS